MRSKRNLSDFELTFDVGNAPTKKKELVQATPTSTFTQNCSNRTEITQQGYTRGKETLSDPYFKIFMRFPQNGIFSYIIHPIKIALSPT